MSKNLGQMGISMLYLYMVASGRLLNSTTAVHSEIKYEKNKLFLENTGNKQKSTFIKMFTKGFF